MEDLIRLGILTASVVMYAILPLFLLTLLVGYILLRQRDNQRQERDPELGIKVALHFFFSVCLLLLLTGLTVVTVDAMTSTKAGRLAPPRDGMSAAQRTGWGLAVAGLLLSVLHFVLVKAMTNDSRRPAARRFFLGWRFVINGLVFVITVAGLIVTLFQKDFGDDNTRKTYLAILLIWGPAWLIHLILLRVLSDGLSRPDRATLPEPVFSPPAALQPGEHPVRAQEAPRSRPTSGPHCAHCNAPLSQQELAEGWCESCGKKLPDRLH
jgi:hypothetical protein